MRKRKRRKSTPEKREERALMKIWRKNALERANNQCEWCGKGQPGLNVHHIISRRYKRLRTNDLNSLVLCARCHKFGVGIAAHENPIRVAVWLLENRPVAWMQLKIETEEVIQNDQVKNSNTRGTCRSINGKKGRNRGGR